MGSARNSQAETLENRSSKPWALGAAGDLQSSLGPAPAQPSESPVTPAAAPVLDGDHCAKHPVYRMPCNPPGRAGSPGKRSGGVLLPP